MRNDIIFKSPMYQKMKQINLEVLEISKKTIELAKKHDKMYLQALQIAFNTIKKLDMFSVLKVSGGIKAMETTLEMFQGNSKKLEDYEDRLINIELIIQSDGVKN